MPLLKRHAGAPLTPAERRQRTNAARARWAVAGGAAGAVIGAEVGRFRQSITNAARAEAQARMQAVIEGERHVAADLSVSRDLERRRQAITAEIRRRLAANPETGRQRQQRMSRLLADRMDTSASAPTHQVVGSAHNLRIYDYQIADLRRRRLVPEQRYLERMIAQIRTLNTGKGLSEEQTEFDLADHPGLRRQRARITAIQRDIDALQELKRLGPRTIARRGSQRQLTGRTITVQGATEQKHVGGEPVRRIQQRISREAGALRSKQREMLQLLEARTNIARQAAHNRVVEDSAAAIRQAFERGEYASKALRASGRGALVGAGIGLTAAGIGILAHHLATHGLGRKPAEKSEPADSLAKARRDNAEDKIGLGLGMTFRRWIDRLLGLSSEPMNLGDGIAEGAGPGIVQAYADGARNPPIDRAGSDPGSYIDVDFDVLNPSVRRHMAEYALDRIVEITDVQREAIRQAIMNQAVLQGEGPYDVARTIKNAIGLTAYQMSVVGRFEQDLRTLDPRIFERKLRDRRYDPALQRAFDTNTPLTEDQIDAMVSAYHRRFVALRSRTIARTEALRATSYGGLARAQQVLDENPNLEVTKRWLSTDDERTRPTHVELNGKEVDGMTTPFITAAGNSVRWPLDENAAAEETINCRCTLLYVFKPKRGQLTAVAV